MKHIHAVQIAYTLGELKGFVEPAKQIHVAYITRLNVH